jgi:hypothetical protein
MDATSFRRRFAVGFNALLDKHGVPASGQGRAVFVSSRFNVNKSSASKWLSGGTLPEPWKLAEIADYFGVSMDEVVGRSFSAKATDEREADGSTEHALSAAFNEVLDAKHTRTRIAVVPPFPADYPRDDSLYLTMVSSPSMEPFVMPGDYVIYKPISHVDRDAEYVLHYQDRLKVRRIASMANGVLRLIAAAGYPTEELKAGDLRPASSSDPHDGAPRLHGRIVARVLVNR